MKKELYVMRHGETLFNVRKKIQGWCDSPLTDKGIKQAERVRDYFQQQEIVFDYGYSSTLERASDTLEIVTQNQLPYTRVKALREMNFGVFEGESEDLNPNRTLFEEFFLDFGGESRMQVRQRVVAAMTEIMTQEAHQRILVVSHAGACFQFLSHCTPPTPEHFTAFANCGMIRYEYEEGTFTPMDIITQEPID